MWNDDETSIHWIELDKSSNDGHQFGLDWLKGGAESMVHLRLIPGKGRRYLTTCEGLGEKLDLKCILKKMKKKFK